MLIVTLSHNIKAKPSKASTKASSKDNNKENNNRDNNGNNNRDNNKDQKTTSNSSSFSPSSKLSSFSQFSQPSSSQKQTEPQEKSGKEALGRFLAPSSPPPGLSFVEKTQDVQKKTSEGPQNLQKKVLEDVQDVQKKVMEKTQNVQKKTSDNIQNLQKKVIEGSQDLQKKVIEGSQDLQKKVIEGSQDLQKKVSEGVQDIQKKLKDQGQNLEKKLKDQSQNLEKKLKEKAQGLQKKIGNQVQKLSKKTPQGGKNKKSTPQKNSSPKDGKKPAKGQIHGSTNDLGPQEVENKNSGLPLPSPVPLSKEKALAPLRHALLALTQTLKEEENNQGKEFPKNQNASKGFKNQESRKINQDPNDLKFLDSMDKIFGPQLFLQSPSKTSSSGSSATTLGASQHFSSSSTSLPSSSPSSPPSSSHSSPLASSSSSSSSFSSRLSSSQDASRLSPSALNQEVARGQNYQGFLFVLEQLSWKNLALLIGGLGNSSLGKKHDEWMKEKQKDFSFLAMDLLEKNLQTLPPEERNYLQVYLASPKNPYVTLEEFAILSNFLLYSHSTALLSFGGFVHQGSLKFLQRLFQLSSKKNPYDPKGGNYITPQHLQDIVHLLYCFMKNRGFSFTKGLWNPKDRHSSSFLMLMDQDTLLFDRLFRYFLRHFLYYPLNFL